MSDHLDEAVEAAARALYLHEHGTYTFANEAWLAGTEGNEKWRQRARAAITAAAPIIAAQATADLRAGIEALRDEWRLRPGADYLHDHADALDALLKERTSGA